MNDASDDKSVKEDRAERVNHEAAVYTEDKADEFEPSAELGVPDHPHLFLQCGLFQLLQVRV